MNRRELYHRALQALMQFQRKNRYVKSAWRVLSIAEQQTLTEIDSPVPLGVAELARRLLLNKGQVSRFLSALEAREWIARSKFSASDQTFFYLTRKGEQLTRATDKLSEHSMYSLTSSLSDSEQRAVHSALAALADALSAPPSVERVGEHPYRVLTRRITRALGLLGNTFLGVNINTRELHTLFAISGRSCLSSSHLSKELDIEHVACVRILNSLKRGRLVTWSSKSRSEILPTITEDGISWLHRSNDALSTALETCTNPAYDHEIARCLPTFEASVSRWPPSTGSSSTEVTVRNNLGYVDLLVARSILIHAAIARGALYRLNSEQQSELFLVREGPLAVAAFAIATNDGQGVLQSWGWNNGASLSKQKMRTVTDAIHSTLKSLGHSQIEAASSVGYETAKALGFSFCQE